MRSISWDFQILRPIMPTGCTFFSSYLSLYARSAFYVPENFKYFFVLITGNTGTPWLVTQRFSCAGCFLFRSWSCLVKSHELAFLRMHTLSLSVISCGLIHFCNYTRIHGSPPRFLPVDILIQMIKYSWRNRCRKRLKVLCCLFVCLSFLSAEIVGRMYCS